MFSVVIATYRREQVLIDTIGTLLPQLAQLDGPWELLVIDQSERHEPATTWALQQWHDQGLIRWQRLSQPHLVQAMNRGLLAARGELVLFVDDDIVPLPGLVQGHIDGHARYPEAWAVVGQILQPGQAPADLPQRQHRSPFWRDLDFPFHRTRGAWIENAMAGNLSVQRERLPPPRRRGWLLRPALRPGLGSPLVPAAQAVSGGAHPLPPAPSLADPGEVPR